MTDDRLREIDDKMIVGADLLDFGAALTLLIIVYCCKNVQYVSWLYTPCYNVDEELLVEQNTEGIL